MTQLLGYTAHWFASSSSSSSSTAAVTPSTIQCTRFYSVSDGRWPQRPSKSSSLLSRYAAQESRSHPVHGRCKPRPTRTRAALAYTAPMPREIIETAPSQVDVDLLGRAADTQPCLDQRLAENLHTCLPARVALAHRWRLLFSLDQHGASLKTLYRRVRDHGGPCLLVLRTAEDELFGAYMSEPLKEQESVHYYGSGECFLWALSDTFHVEVFPWTGANDYMVLSNRDFFALGGGNGCFGLWLHADLTHGHTESCPTFDNPRLAKTSNFECVGVEVWGFQF